MHTTKSKPRLVLFIDKWPQMLINSERKISVGITMVCKLHGLFFISHYSINARRKKQHTYTKCCSLSLYPPPSHAHTDTERYYTKWHNLKNRQKRKPWGQCDNMEQVPQGHELVLSMQMVRGDAHHFSYTIISVWWGAQMKSFHNFHVICNMWPTTTKCSELHHIFWSYWAIDTTCKDTNKQTP